MQLIFQYYSWTIQATQGIVGRQYDNLAHSLVVQGQLPEGYTWDMLVECQGHKNIIPLSPVECGLRAPLTADQLALDLVEKNLVTNQLVLTVGYDRESLQNPNVHYQGEVTTDRYGRSVPKHAHGTQNLERYTSSGEDLLRALTPISEDPASGRG